VFEELKSQNFYPLLDPLPVSSIYLIRKHSFKPETLQFFGPVPVKIIVYRDKTAVRYFFLPYVVHDAVHRERREQFSLQANN